MGRYVKWRLAISSSSSSSSSCSKWQYW
jgi:hypothetical protein